MLESNSYRHIPVLLAVMAFAFSVNCQRKKTPETSLPGESEVGEEVIKNYEQTYGDKLLLPSREVSFAKMIKDVNIDLQGEIDLVNTQATLNYELLNSSQRPESFLIKKSMGLRDSVRMTLSFNQKQSFRISDKMEISSISSNTRFVHIRPYLVIKQNNERYKILMGKYNAKVRVKIPAGGRIVRSTVPFKMENAVTGVWEMHNIAVLPPIEVWYTVAPEDISLSKEVTEDQGRITLKLTVKNNVATPCRKLSFSTRIPNTFFTPVQEESEGVFTLSQNVMFLWNYELAELQGHGSRQIRLRFQRNDSALPFDVPVITVHNSAGDLLAVE